MSKEYFVCILASKPNGTLYKGVTSDLIKLVWQHKEIIADGFMKKYNVDKPVYFERFLDPENGIKREKRLIKYPHKWKVNLIEKNNPDWHDLYDRLRFGQSG